jgi:hypothetical protein
MLLISPFVKPGTVNETGYFNHFTLLLTIEELFELEKLGYATNSPSSRSTPPSSTPKARWSLNRGASDRISSRPHLRRSERAPDVARPEQDRRVVAEQMEAIEGDYGDDCEIGDVCTIVEVVGPHGSHVRVRSSDMRPTAASA